MFVPRLYYPHDLALHQIIHLDKEVSHYLANVLRLKSHDAVIVFNGQGGEYHGQVSIEKKSATISIDSFISVDRESALKIHLGQGLSRGDRMDYVIQKATELGVASIQPLFSATCNVKLEGERSQKRLEHWQNIAISACEQSGRTSIPEIYSPIELQQWVSAPFAGLSVAFDLETKTPIKSLQAQENIRIAIGPESGWTENEAAFMMQKGFTVCSLGKRILRTETAPVVALSILQGFFGDI